METNWCEKTRAYWGNARRKELFLRERENNQSQHYGADGSGSSKCHGGIKRLVPTLHAHVGPRKKYQDGIEECAFICILVFHLFYTENK